MFKIIFSVLVILSSVGCAQIEKQEASIPYFSESAKPVVAYALADSLTTAVAVSSGIASEANPLINTAPLALAGLFVLKAGMVYYLDKQRPAIRENGLKLNSGLWAGVSINNLLVIAGVANPVALAGGFLGGIGAYYYEESLLNKEKLEKQAHSVPSVVITKLYTKPKGTPRLVITKSYKNNSGVVALTTTKYIY